MNTLSKLCIATLLGIGINTAAIAGDDSNPAPIGDGQRKMTAKSPGSAPKIGGKFAERAKEGASKRSSRQRSGNFGSRAPARQRSAPNRKD